MTSIATPPDLHTDYGSQKQQGGKINSDHAAIEAWCTALLAALAKVIRADDTLVDAIVRLRNLHPEVWEKFKVLRTKQNMRMTTVWPDGKLVYEIGEGTLWVGDGSTQGGLPASGSGSGGSGVIWHTITSNTTAMAGHGYRIDARENPVTLTLPASPSVDDRVPVVAIDTTYTARVARNGSLLVGGSEDLDLEYAGDGVDLLFTGMLFGWTPTNALHAVRSGMPLTAADLAFAPTPAVPEENTQEAIEGVQARATAAASAASDAASAAYARAEDAEDAALVYAIVFGGG